MLHYARWNNLNVVRAKPVKFVWSTLFIFFLILCNNKVAEAGNVPVVSGDGLWLEIPPPPSSGPSNFFTRRTLTGDWGGFRNQLENVGINPLLFAFNQSAWNPVGGRDQAFSNSPQLAFGANIDLGKSIGLDGGALNIMFNWQGGTSNSVSHVGNLVQDVNNYAYGFEDFRLADLKYQQAWFGGKVLTTVGFFAPGDNFARTPDLCNFQNVGFCIHPFSLFVDSGFDAFPGGVVGGVIKYYPTQNIYLQAGSFDVDPINNAKRSNGFKVNLDGSTGALNLLELGVKGNIGPEALPNFVKLGGYYDTSTVSDVAEPTVSRTGRYGGYIVGQQMLLRFAPNSTRGLTAYAQFSIGDERTSLIPYSYSFELIAKGPFASRPNDDIAFGFVRSPINKRLLHAENLALQSVAPGETLEQGETDFELDYGVEIAPWLKMSPNLQVILDPGAFSGQHIPNALVFGNSITAVF